MLATELKPELEPLVNEAGESSVRLARGSRELLSRALVERERVRTH